ncbi:hypothetical protein, partial [Ruminiclostridium cellobioparum]|uniref:hypothetical protein n=1 Tax=Ruminiclostridium cellobioparum TaxID=29355 RepID=UPI00138E140E
TTVNVKQGDHVTSASTYAGSNVTINNYGIMDTITTGKNSSLTLNNYGTVKNEVRLGENATAVIVNNKGAYIKDVIGGNITDKNSQKGINATNYGEIHYIQTGAYSTNEVFNYGEGYVDWLETGVGNSSTTDGGTKHYSGQGNVKVISDLDKLKSNLYQLGYHNVYTNYTSARNQFLKDYLDNGHSLDSNFKLMGSGEHYSTLLSWTNKAINGKYTNIAGGEILFLASDTNLKPEVQQMISYYDDMYFYAHVAYDSNIIDEYEFKALKSFCKEKVEKLRKDNSFKKADNLTYQIICSIGSVIPYAGIIFDVLGDTQPVYAADLSSEATKKISANMSAINSTIKSSKRFDYRYTVYELYDDDGVKYVGRTRQSIEARQKQHWKADSNKNGLRIRAAEFEGKTLKGLSHSEARGLEHLVFESHGGFNNKNLLNKIKPLDINNPKVTKKVTNYIDDAWNFIKKLK